MKTAFVIVAAMVAYVVVVWLVEPSILIRVARHLAAISGRDFKFDESI
jgi:hypothetical protein